ncbi:hypothetical protein ASF32_09325 [Methylobacterium sp. Leaf91]|nr:hypothetical protein ASF32_09325 [Methylobacterium sp. Leaf91]
MLIIDRMVAMVRSGPGPSPEERAAATARYQAEEHARQVRQAEEREAYLGAAPRYVLPDGSAWRSAQMLGRLSNGGERDRGRLYHIVSEDGCGPMGGAGSALCGATPGRRSVGWGDVEGTPATCPRCLKRVAS